MMSPVMRAPGAAKVPATAIPADEFPLFKYSRPVTWGVVHNDGPGRPDAADPNLAVQVSECQVDVMVEYAVAEVECGADSGRR